MASVEQQDVPVLAGICLALKIEHAGEFLARNLDRLPGEDPKQFTEYLKTPGDQTRGAALFTANCAACHQVTGRGKQVGPNLDGIGTRGLNRLAEDVLAPNRNVDINFHATTLVTDDGRVHTGLLRPTTGVLTVIVNSDGKEIRVPTESIDEKITSRLSPMPDNVTEKLSPAEFNDLMAYLLSLGN